MSADLIIDAALPSAEVLTPAFRSLCCSSVRVLTPSWRYLKELRFLDCTFCGSCSVMISFLPNSSSLTKSLHIFALIFSRSTVSHANTFPVFLSATICVLSVNTLNVTGSTISPSSFFLKCSLIKLSPFKGIPVTGFVPWFSSHGSMLSMSKIWP